VWLEGWPLSLYL
jgi:hypothetical protein